ncbi:TolC family outer membrane protein [Ramlibacter sp.]|uniref:TolC family outer membrane protein n=1 Tax=Ramlibacter sp. TaxID=1917967 RepID=UPI002CFBC62C|nr:TolC family outer membrane protein [Ramlibacter sp.]HWI84497.1 TolC family outer membrane protein [Ramlibacter sp.]
MAMTTSLRITPRALPLAAVAIAVLAAMLPLSGAAQTNGSTPKTPEQPAPGSAATAVSLNLEQAYRAALEQDAVIRAATAGAAARRERLPQARAQLLPNVSATASRFRNDLATTQPGFGGVPLHSEQMYNSGNRALTIRQPLYRPLNFADYQQAKAQVEDANATLDKELQNVAVRVSGAYLEGLLAQDQLALVLAQKEAYTTQLDAARRRFAAGAGVRTDIDEAQARVDMTIAQELEARQNLGYTKRQLQVLVNTPIASLATVDPDKLRAAQPAPGQLQEWTERAEQASPELRSLRAQQEVARQEIEKARAGHKPTVDAIAQWSVSDSDNVTRVDTKYNSKSIGVQVNIPIFAGGYVSSQVRQALAEQERIDNAFEATRRDLALRVEKEYRGITEGALRIRALEQAVRSAETMVQSNRRSYEAGSRTLVDILNAEQERVSAMRDLANARYVYMMSRIRLRALAGQADDQAVRELNGWLKL